MLEILDLNSVCKLANLSQNANQTGRYNCTYIFPEYENLFIHFRDLPSIDIINPYRYYLELNCNSFNLLLLVEEDLFSIGREEDTPLILPGDVMMLDEISREELIFDDVVSDLLFLKMFIG